MQNIRVNHTLSSVAGFPIVLLCQRQASLYNGIEAVN